VHWDIPEQMTDIDVGIIVQRAKETSPEACPRSISDNGPQFIAKDFKKLIRTLSMSHILPRPTTRRAMAKSNAQ
jgi:hypothetical protein